MTHNDDEIVEKFITNGGWKTEIGNLAIVELLKEELLTLLATIRADHARELEEVRKIIRGEVIAPEGFITGNPEDEELVLQKHILTTPTPPELSGQSLMANMVRGVPPPWFKDDCDECKEGKTHTHSATGTPPELLSDKQTEV